MGKGLKEAVARMSLIFSGLIIGLILVELLLRVYHPIPTRIKGHDIHLLTNYRRTVNVKIKIDQKGLDETMVYSTNSIGFRGNEPPENFEDYLTIFTVGGSTTECSLLDDQKTWSSYLNDIISNHKDSVWINNAGIDGASTIGHHRLLTEHLISYKPDVILFLVGINEMWIADYGEELLLNKSREHKLRNIADHSELFSLAWNVYRSAITKKMRAGHHTDKIMKDLSQEEFEEKKIFYIKDQVKYKSRLKQLVSDCLDHNITPILITQPVYNLTDLHPYSFVRIYNETTKQVSSEYNIPLIDLASKLEDETDYYYDPVHFTFIGTRRVAEIITDGLIDILFKQE